MLSPGKSPTKRCGITSAWAGKRFLDDRQFTGSSNAQGNALRVPTKHAPYAGDQPATKPSPGLGNREVAPVSPSLTPAQAAPWTNPDLEFVQAPREERKGEETT
jgi:hypothetical protein